MLHRIAVLACLAFAVAVSPAAAAESAYTRLDFDRNCKPVGPPATEEDEALGAVSLLCRGYAGYPVEYAQADERTSVHYGDPARVTTRSAWESFQPFNSVSGRIEWRLDEAGRPFAAILRYSIARGEDSAARGQVLVVSKVGQPGGPAGCAVGLVDALANSNANALARRVADDLAPDFACGRDRVAYHGRRGDKAADFQASFEE